MITLATWGRGFSRFGDSVREGSHAEFPTALVMERDGYENELGPEACLAEMGRSPDIADQLAAFVIFVDCNPDPRWLTGGPDRDVNRAAWLAGSDREASLAGAKTLVLHDLGSWLTWWDGEAVHDRFYTLAEGTPEHDLCVDFRTA